MEQMMATKKRRSVKLTQDERKAFKQFRKTFDTDVECAEAIGISREVLIRVGILGSGAPETIDKIRTKLNSLEG